MKETTRAAVFHDVGRTRARLNEIRACFPDKALHAVAIKANPVVRLLREVVAQGVGLEAASMEEVHVALEAGCPAERIVYDSAVKTREEIEESLALGVYLNVDSFEELRRVAEARPRFPQSRSRFGLRINPEVGSGSIGFLSVGGLQSKFGVSLSREGRAIVEAFRRYSWLTGLHVHVGSQGCDLSLLVDGCRRAVELKRSIETTCGEGRVDTVDIGGGLPIAYMDDDVPVTMEDYAAALRQKVPELFDPRIQLVTEFGRAVQVNCGFAASRVEYVKPYGDRRLALVHLGADFLMRRVYQPELWNHGIAVLDGTGKVKDGPPSRWTIGGPLCFAGDVLADDVELPRIEEGDWLIIGDTGGYTLSLWSRHCNRGMPVVLGYDSASSEPFTVLREAESPRDVARFWS